MTAASIQRLADITGRVEGILAAVTGVRDAAACLAAEAAAAGRALRPGDLAALQPLAAGVLAANKGFAAGAGVVFAPGVVAGVAHCLEWWWAGRGGEISKLAVDLDPASPEFYDYTTATWYQEPERSGGPAVTGPYVDYICTREYTFTVSVPLRIGGRFAGVAGADVLADEVERLALPALARLPGNAVLIGGNGRVIASNHTGLLPGSVLGAGAAGRCLWRHATLPWALLAAPATGPPPASSRGSG